jgi:hypothetical protein
MKAKFIILAALAMGLVGCEEMGGETHVAQAFNVIVKNQKVTVQPGQYRTSLNFERDKVEVTLLSENNSKTKIKFYYAQGTTFPSNGPFELKSEQTGQPVDIKGNIQTVETRSQPQRGYQNCQYQDYQTICNEQGCTTVPVNRWGRQYTEYYVRTIQRNVDFEILESHAQANKLANFNGASAYSQNVITWQDRCF